MSYDADVLTTWLDGQEVAVATIPDADLRACYGMGHFRRHMAGRRVHLGMFPYTPDICPAEGRRSEWRGSALVCTGCGLDWEPFEGA